MADKKYLDYAGLKRTLAKLLPGARKIWHGNINEWDALPAAEKDKYDQAEITINAVNKIELGNKNLVMNKAIKVWHPELIGNIYFSNVLTTAVTLWDYTKSVTFSNLPAGKYILLGHVSMQANPGAGWTMILSTNGATVGMGCQTGDYFAKQGALGMFVNEADGNKVFKLDLYCQWTRTLTVALAAIKIA